MPLLTQLALGFETTEAINIALLPELFPLRP